MLLDLQAHYPWAMGVLLGDDHPSELETLDKLSARATIELATTKSSVDNSDHLVNSSVVKGTIVPLTHFLVLSSGDEALYLVAETRLISLFLRDQRS